MTLPGTTAPAAARRGRAVALLLSAALLLPGPCVTGARAQADLSVFRKEGADEAQMSRDRHDCHLQAVREGEDPARGPDPTAPPVAVTERSRQGQKVLKEQGKMDRWKQQTRYNRAVRSCLEARGYRVADDPGTPPPDPATRP